MTNNPFRSLEASCSPNPASESSSFLSVWPQPAFSPTAAFALTQAPPTQPSILWLVIFSTMDLVMPRPSPLLRSLHGLTDRPRSLMTPSSTRSARGGHRNLCPSPECVLLHPTHAGLARAFSYIWDNLNRTCLLKSFLPYKGQLKRIPEQEEILRPVKAPNPELEALAMAFLQRSHHHQASQHLCTEVLQCLSLSLQGKLRQGSAFCVQFTVVGPLPEECLTHSGHSITPVG